MVLWLQVQLGREILWLGAIPRDVNHFSFPLNRLKLAVATWPITVSRKHPTTVSEPPLNPRVLCNTQPQYLLVTLARDLPFFVSQTKRWKKSKSPLVLHLLLRIYTLPFDCNSKSPRGYTSRSVAYRSLPTFWCGSALLIRSSMLRLPVMNLFWQPPLRSVRLVSPLGS